MTSREEVATIFDGDENFTATAISKGMEMEGREKKSVMEIEHREQELGGF